jgi:hypothetical protein
MTSPFRHITKLKQGKQGITGVVRDATGKEMVYKISQDMSFLPEHEYAIMDSLASIGDFCPGFLRPIALIPIPINPHFRDPNINPFSAHSKPIVQNVLFVEYIDQSTTLAELIQDDSIDDNVVINVIKQVLMSVLIAQREVQFVHYDLHSENILVVQGPVDSVNLYRLDEANAIALPTLGYVPTIIDFGYSSSVGLQGKHLGSSLGLTKWGYLAPYFDEVADMKLFLVSVSEDFKRSRPTALTEEFRSMTKHLFKPLQIDWETGWDINRDVNIMDEIYHVMQNERETSKVWTEDSYAPLDILQHMVPVPLRRSRAVLSEHELRKAYKHFMGEFRKIEDEINDTFYTLYVFHHMVIIALEVEKRYRKPATRTKAIQEFADRVFGIVYSVAKFVQLKNVHWELLLCSLFVIQEQLAGRMFELMQQLVQRKTTQYAQLDMSSLDQVFTLLDLLFPTRWHGTPDSIVTMYDVLERDANQYMLSDKEWDAVNEEHPVHRGMVILEILYTE